VRSALFAASLFFAACSYLLPASWRAFRVDPDDAAPAITRAVDSMGFAVASFDQAKKTITTQWVQTSSGVTRKRERYIIRWERDPKEKSLTVYARHEESEKEIGEGGGEAWGPTYHDDAREQAMLDRIAKELASDANLTPPPGE
jgi:hypothetical protein